MKIVAVSIFGTNLEFQDKSFMKWNIDHLPAFVTVADQGGISAAARHLNQPKSTLSRIVAKLEEDVGLQLFVRGKRDLRLTHDGARFYQHAMRIMEQVDAASAELAGLSEAPRGRLTVALPMAFSREIVGPNLPGFLASYPELQLDVRIASGVPDLVRNTIDMAVVVGEQPDSDFIQQRLVNTPLIWIASPQMAATLPENPPAERLMSHISVLETRYANLPLPITDSTDGQTYTLSPGSVSPLQVNDPLLVRDMVAAGHGISFAPDIYCRGDLANGRLVRIASRLQIGHASMLSLLYPSRRLLPKKSRAFIEFLRDCTAGLTSAD